MAAQVTGVLRPPAQLCFFPGGQLYLALGSDMFLSFRAWKEYREIFKMAVLVVQSRKDGDSEELMNMAGMDVGGCRLPLGPASRYNRRVLRNLAKAVGSIKPERELYK